MVVKELREEKAQEFLKGLTCPDCGKRAAFNGEGQAGIWRIYCYFCEDCDTIWQLIIEKKGVKMFEEAPDGAECRLVPDKRQDKCNLCACGLYSRSDTLGP